MKIKFLGAAQNVTGSRFLLETGKSRILIDCGLYQERDLKIRNWDMFPVNPGTIDSVLITHAHADHCGYLPKFVREGFKGNIFCTHPTQEIAEIVLLDSAHLQEADAEYKEKRHKKEQKEPVHPEIPLFTAGDAVNVSKFFNPLSYNETVKISEDIEASFHDAGHILGSSMIKLKIKESNKETTCVFSGDIGRWNKPILCNPTLFDKADIVITESTYGNKINEDQLASEKKLENIINETVKAGGNIIIPSFAVERSQELLYYLSLLLRKNRIKPINIYLDSPMAIDVTQIFRKYLDYFDEKTKSLFLNHKSPFDFPLLKITKTTDESKEINNITEPSIIIAGSGMCTGGRVKHHLANNIEIKKNTILFIGYQAQGTLGREIIEKPPTARILGKQYNLLARIEKINGFSGHADKDELFKWIKGFKTTPKRIFVVHGDKEVSFEFATFLRENLSSTIEVPQFLEEYII